MVASIRRLVQAITSASFVISSLLVFAFPASAATVVLRAVDDFPVRDAGAAPYYAEPNRGALAINASDVNYRNVFAKAETTFSGVSGTYDVTLIGLAELDGEANYRVSVNNTVVGEAANPVTSIDFFPIAHRFNKVTVNTGDVIAIESLANSNGKIPEDGGFAFARGRWTELRLTPDGETDVQQEKVSLIANASSLNENVAVGDSVTIDYAAFNEDSAGATATEAALVLEFPASFIVPASSNCTAIDSFQVDIGKVNCPLSELAPGAAASGQIQLDTTAAADDVPVHITVIANETDVDGGDNRATMRITVTAVDITPSEPEQPESEPVPNSEQSEPTAPTDQNDIEISMSAPVAIEGIGEPTSTGPVTTGGAMGFGSNALLLLMLGRVYRRKERP